MTRRTLVAGALVLSAGMLSAGLVLTGCVERRMLVRSDPAGARLLLDLDEIEGRTPIEVPVEHGGTREVTLIAPGHAVFEGTAEIQDPWFTWFPLDFVAELVWPGTIEDVQTFDFSLRAYPDRFAEGDLARLEQRIEEVRARADLYRAGGANGPVDAADDDVPPPPPATREPRGAPMPTPTPPPTPPPPRSQPRFGR